MKKGDEFDEGDLRKGDKMKKILFAKKFRGLILFGIEWEQRDNGVKPEISFYDNEQLKKLAPQILIDFYEERISFD